MEVYNVNKRHTEKISRVYRVRADEYVEINEPVLPGDIVALAGLTYTSSGDTLLRKTDTGLELANVELPSPVFFC
jgi:translation elongation factor EF-G